MLYCKLLKDLSGKLTRLFSVNFQVKVNRKSELTRIHLKVSSTGEESKQVLLAEMERGRRPSSMEDAVVEMQENPTEEAAISKRKLRLHAETQENSLPRKIFHIIHLFSK